MKTKRHHIVISGTGRAGTSFLVKLLTGLGIDTGFTANNIDLDTNARAGLEWDICNRNAPYVVKSPWLCSRIDEVLRNEDIIIDQAIIPIRNLNAAALSRVKVEEMSNGIGIYKRVKGGLWLTDDPEEQSHVLAEQFHNLIFALVRADIQITFCNYPRIVKDSAYLWSKIKSIFFSNGDISYGRFQSLFYEIVRPEFVHQYTLEDV
jgi:hypothetical protein